MLTGENSPLQQKNSGFWGYRVGERVSVTVGGRYIGKGTVLYVSTDPEIGLGTKLYPSYQVQYDEEDGGGWDWLNGVSLKGIRE